MSATWRFTEIEEVELLEQTREQLHQASQIAAAVARTYKPKVKDDHFANFLWNSDREMLQGHTIEADENFSTALELKTLSIHLLSTSGDTMSSFELDGKTQHQCLIWLEEQLVNLGLAGNLLSIQLPYEIPKYPTAKGKEFEITDKEYFEELSNYFSNTNLVLSNLLKSEPNASEISCWPHHFDIATLVTLNDTGDPETSTSIGVGMSPGDSGYNEPYFYLTPWPYPNVAELPQIEGPGKWHTDGWVGGVLTGSELSAHSQKDNQEEIVHRFLKQGVNNLKALLNS